MNTIIMNFDGSADVNAVYNHIKALYPTVKMAKSNISIDELIEDENLFDIAMLRKKNDSGKRITFEEHLAKRGMTLLDIESMEDVEIE